MGVLGRPRLRACSVLSSANLLPGLGAPDMVWAIGTAGLPDLLLHDHHIRWLWLVWRLMSGRPLSVLLDGKITSYMLLVLTCSTKAKTNFRKKGNWLHSLKTDVVSKADHLK